VLNVLYENLLKVVTGRRMEGCLTALTRARSYGDFLSCGDGSTRTMCSNLDSRRLKFIGVGSGYADGDRDLVAAIVCTSSLSERLCGECDGVQHEERSSGLNSVDVEWRDVLLGSVFTDCDHSFARFWQLGTARCREWKQRHRSRDRDRPIVSLPLPTLASAPSNTTD
jgi:hypothetical protein